MDARVNDFLNEINELSAPQEAKDGGEWEKCYDEESGYPYYWNTKTDEVTWDKPLKVGGGSKGRQPHLFVPTSTRPDIPRADIARAVKIYKIGEPDGTPLLKHSEYQSKTKVPCPPAVPKVNKRPYTKMRKPSSDSEDEKIVLISSYGGESSTDEEDLSPATAKTSEVDKPRPRDSKLNVVPAKAQSEARTVPPPKSPRKSTAVGGGLSLVAGYSDSEEEEEEKEEKGRGEVEEEEEKAPEKAAKPEAGVSTLFPAARHIDVREFEKGANAPHSQQQQQRDVTSRLGGGVVAVASTTESDSVAASFDPKAFQRKRRIGVALINTAPKRTKEDPDQQQQQQGEAETPPPEDGSVAGSSERKGLGFAAAEGGSVAMGTTTTATTEYPGFKSGGVMFANGSEEEARIGEGGGGAETSRSPPSSFPAAKGRGLEEKKVGNKRKLYKDTEDVYVTVKEKLGFLGEGREPVFPVQVMLIQVETLYDALKSGDLKEAYLHKWLTDTSADLIKLEKEATPEGWLLQWDRKHKRYYYMNVATGESQWEYPQPDVTRCDEAMDICTTPPPPPHPPHPHSAAHRGDDIINGGESENPELGGRVSARRAATPPAIDSVAAMAAAVAAAQPPPPPPPSPPSIQNSGGVPSPPPPPKISSGSGGNGRSHRHHHRRHQHRHHATASSSASPATAKRRRHRAVPLPLQSEESSLDAYKKNEQPLPPGVDPPEEPIVAPLPKPQPLPQPKVDVLTDALNSFYSDIAAIEETTTVVTANSPPPATMVPVMGETFTLMAAPAPPEAAKKKKKTKVKMAQGLTMKKKEVSKLVEKWKNVSYDGD